MIRRRSKGFTLVELVVSISIFSIVAVMAYGGYRESAANAERAREQARRLQAVQLSLRTMVSDFRMLAPRAVREPVGDGFRACLVRDAAGGYLVEMTRAGWSNTAGTPRGSLQRVAYSLDNGKLVRLHWNVLDPTLDLVPVRRELADRVQRVDVRFMNATREWVDRWPPPDSQAPMNLRQRPLAVEIIVEFEDLGVIRRIAEVTG
jgi:general secretion pathway protein J